MISIIIASANQKHLQDLKINIAETIGLPFEIISFDNGDGSKGLCELYNEGARIAKFGILCYMHEDINIKTNQWGKIVQNAFNENRNLGIIGVAGSVYKALSPSGWHSNSENTERTNIIQTFKFSEKKMMHHTVNPLNEKTSKVACVDGVWFCTLKHIVLQNPFDEHLFKGFHAYDIDFSLQVGQHYDINVRYDILMHHYSEGNFNDSWIIEIIKLSMKWNKILPVNTTEINRKTSLLIEKRTFKDFIDKAVKSGIDLSIIRKLLGDRYGIKRFNFLLFIKIYRYLLMKKKN